MKMLGKEPDIKNCANIFLSEKCVKLFRILYLLLYHIDHFYKCIF